MNTNNIGYLSASTFAARGGIPIQNAEITVTRKENDKVIFQQVLFTDGDGNTPRIPVCAPPMDLSLDENNEVKPYAQYTLTVDAPGFIPLEIRNVQVFAGRESITPIEMLPFPEVGKAPSTDSDIFIPNEVLFSPQPNGGVVPQPIAPPSSFAARKVIEIPEHNLFVVEDRDNVVGPPPSSFLLRQVVIPEFIVVHLGKPAQNAENLWVSFPEYIKNVASSEIYPTWPENSLRANIYAQISFALNRIYTEWYRSKGYDFQITNSTSYDQKFIKGRNIFESVSKIVDEIFSNYVVRPGSIEPYFTEYCDGKQVTCKGMKQWGTVDLAKQNYTPQGILEYYYGPIEIATASAVKGVPSSYPGTPLRLGSTGEEVKTIQKQLNRIGKNYPNIKKVPVDGVFREDTQTAVKEFQKVFNMTQDGVVGRSTWYKIGYIYTSVKKLAELTSEGEQPDVKPGSYPGYPIKQGQSSDHVKSVQYILTFLSNYYYEINPLTVDGSFGPNTTEAVKSFQTIYGLTPDGIVGKSTWEKLMDVYLSIKQNLNVPIDTYPGYLLKRGSTGQNVEKLQTYLNAIHISYPIVPLVQVDGLFGAGTETAVKSFQKHFGLSPIDGVVGPDTWNEIVNVYYSVLNKDFYGGVPLKLGSSGSDVQKSQTMLKYLSTQTKQLPSLLVDGMYGTETQEAVKQFQASQHLAVDGVIERNTWNHLVNHYNHVYSGGKKITPPPSSPSLFPCPTPPDTPTMPIPVSCTNYTERRKLVQLNFSAVLCKENSPCFEPAKKSCSQEECHSLCKKPAITCEMESSRFMTYRKMKNGCCSANLYDKSHCNSHHTPEHPIECQDYPQCSCHEMGSDKHHENHCHEMDSDKHHENHCHEMGSSKHHENHCHEMGSDKHHENHCHEMSSDKHHENHCHEIDCEKHHENHCHEMGSDKHHKNHCHEMGCGKHHENHSHEMSSEKHDPTPYLHHDQTQNHKHYCYCRRNRFYR